MSHTNILSQMWDSDLIVFCLCFAESSISADSDCQSHVWRRLRVEEEGGRGSDGRASRKRPTRNRQQRKRRHFRNATSPSATVSGENHGKTNWNSYYESFIMNAEDVSQQVLLCNWTCKDYSNNTPPTTNIYVCEFQVGYPFMWKMLINNKETYFITHT